MNKGKSTMSKETEKTLENMQDADLRCLLDEVCSYKHTGDMQGKSPLVQGLLRQAEESESGEESIKRPPKRHKKPKERRRRKESDSLAARTHAGGSLDNIGGEKAQTAARQRGVAGRTREGGSCCNLSRGSFETTVARRRRRRDPHRQHGGSLEDLSAIDETAAGAGRAKSSVSESGKHGGSLQNINQEGGGDFRPPAAAAAATTTAPAPAPVPAVAATTAPPPVIDIDAESLMLTASRPSPRGRPEPSELERPPSREEARADATVNFSLRPDPGLHGRLDPREPPCGLPTDLDRVARDTGAILAANHIAYTAEDVRDMPKGELLAGTQRRSQVAGEGGGGSALNGQRPGASVTPGSGRIRKNKKKEEPEVLTQNVDGYRGKADLDTLLGFIESGDKKDKNGRKSDKTGKKETKNRKNGVRAGEEERAARTDRCGGRGAERRPSGRGGGKAAPAGRSSSLEARSAPAAAAAGAAAAHGRDDATSVFCGDLAKSSLKKSDSCGAARPAAEPSVVAFDGSTYVSPPAAERESEGFVQDFYSVTTDSTAIEETEFHVVTRKQRRRAGARAAAGDAPRPQPLRHKTSSLDESARARHDSLGQTRRPFVPGLRHATSSSAPHSELSDSDSDGAGSLPPPPPPPPPSLVDPGGGGGGRVVRASPPPAPAPASAGGSSWADVTRSRQESQPATTATAAAVSQQGTGMRDAETSTDFIDGVGPIFGERSSPKGRPVAAVAAFVRGASEPADCLIGGSHPDEFPEIGPAVGAAPVAARSPRTATAATSAAPSAVTASGGVPAPAVAAPPAAPAAQKAAPRSSAAQLPARTGGSAAAPAAASPAASAPAASAPAAPAPAASAPAASAPAAAAPAASAPAAAAPVPTPTPTVPAVRAPATAAASADPSSAVTAADRPGRPAPASDTDSPAAGGSAREPALAAARRTKKAPAVTIRGSLEDHEASGAAIAHVQGIQFGYIDAWSEPERPAAPSTPAAPSAVDVFCHRFRAQPVDYSRFNWKEVCAFLSKAYDEATRDPSAFLVENGLRSPCTAARPPR